MKQETKNTTKEILLVGASLSLLLFSLCFASAINLVADEPYSFDLGKPFAYYIISEDSSEVNLNISQNLNIVTIIPDKYMQDSNFTITFYGEQNEVIGSSSSSSESGGGGSLFKGVTIKGGKTRFFNEGESFKFKLSESHKLTLEKVYSDYVSLKIQSDPFYVNLSINDELDLDLEEDGYYDLRIILLEIVNGKAKIYFEEINEKVEDLPNQTNMDEPEEPIDADEPIIPESDDGWKILLWTSIILIVVFFIVRKLLKKEGNNN